MERQRHSFLARLASLRQFTKIATPTARSGRVLVTLLMMLLTTTAAWADITGSGTAADPYIISSTDDWNTFGSWMSSDSDKRKAYYALGADISVTTAVCKNNLFFQGTFDGCGHTLTFNATADGYYFAPFCSAKNATFKRLHIDGTITSSKIRTAGLLGTSWGNVTITGWGGFVGHGSESVTFNDCLFDGTISSTNATKCSGFIGIRFETSTFNRCYDNGIISINSGAEPFFNNHKNSHGEGVLNSCFFKTNTSSTFSEIQGMNVNSASNEDILGDLGTSWEIKSGAVVPKLTGTYSIAEATITGVEAQYLYLNGAAITINPTVKDANNNILTKNTHYTVTIRNSSDEEVNSVTEAGNYTLTVTGLAPDYSGSKTVNFTVVNYDSKPEALQGDASNGFYVNMPTTGTTTLTFTDATLKTFKVYDDGGSNKYYSRGCNGYLEITVPTGYAIHLSGKVSTVHKYNDYLEIYNSDNSSMGVERRYQSDPTWKTITERTSSGRTMKLHFTSVTWTDCSYGLDLTVTLVPSTDLANGTISGIKEKYQYTGSAITLDYTVKDENGNTLTLDEHYTATIKNSSNQTVTSVSAADLYTLFIDGISPYTGQKKANFTVYVATPTVNGLQSRYTHTGSPITLNYTVTDDEGNTLTKDVHYTVTVKNSKNETVTSIVDADDYTLTVQGLNPYGGTKDYNFAVTVAPVGMSEEGDGTIYVNMPYSSYNQTVHQTIDIFNTRSNTIKVYDDGGKDGNYSDNGVGVLTLTVPDGYKLEVQGCVWTFNNSGKLSIYDGNEASGTALVSELHSPGWGQETDFGPVVSSGNCVTLKFSSLTNNEPQKGMDVTVRIVNATVEYNVNIATVTGGKIESNKEKATFDAPVTLTATPGSDYLLTGLSIKDASDNDIAYTGSTNWYDLNNNFTFNMPSANISVTPEFTAKTELFVNMPVGFEATTQFTIPDGILTFNVYDDGGKDGEYTLTGNNNEYLKITAPEGYFIQLTGTTDFDYSGRLYVYDGLSTEDTQLLEIWDKHDIGRILSTGRDMTIHFNAKSTSGSKNGFALTVTLVSANTTLAVSLADGTTHGTIQIDPASAKPNQTVTLTSQPEEGYLLNSIIVTDEAGLKQTISADLTWYTGNTTATFKMPASKATVTPVFGNTTEHELSVNIPKEGTLNITIPGSVKKFKVYDEGGSTTSPTYTSSKYIYLTLTAPEHYNFKFTGSASSGRWNSIKIFKGEGENKVNILDDDREFSSSENLLVTGNVVTIESYSSDGKMPDLDLSVSLEPIVYNVAFNKNAEGATGTMNNQLHAYNNPRKLSKKNFSYTGYTFLGWATAPDGDVAYSDEQEVINLAGENDATVTLYAKWRPNTYKIVFEKGENGHPQGSMADQTFTYDVKQKLNTNAFTYEGYTFHSWLSRLGGTYTNEQEVLNITAADNQTIIFTAQWKGITYTVSFNKNGGTGDDMAPQTFEYGKGGHLTPNSYTRTGYTFLGWAEGANGGFKYVDYQTVINLTKTQGANIELYALWKPITYTVSFNKNGGTGDDMAAQNFTYDKAQNLTANSYTRTGYSFAGWATSADGDVVYTDQESVNNLTDTQDDNIELFAKWKRPAIAITNGGGNVITSEDEITVPSLDYTRNLSAPSDAASADAVIGGTPMNVFTLCLPYAPATGDGIKYYTLSGSTATSLQFAEVDNADVAANTPYLVTVSATTSVGLAAPMDNVTLKKDAGNSVKAGGYKFVGTTIGLTNAEAAAKNAYILQGQNKWGQVLATDGYTGAYIPPFRAYIEAPVLSAPQMNTDFSDISGIHSLQLVDRDGTEHWYDLNGHRIEKPTAKGVYINNGKKVIVK